MHILLSPNSKTYPEAKMASASGRPQGPQSPILLLKDYLRDDLSSCSSSGFKSLPRRQCCLHPRSPSCTTTKSALQKASEAVLNAIKSLQIPARQRSPSSSQTRRRKAKKGGGGGGGGGGSALSRSLSRRLLSRSFWRKASKGDKPSTFPTATSCVGNSNSWVETSFTCSLTAAEDSTDIEVSVTTTNTCSVTNSTRDWPEEKEQFSPVSVLDCPLFDDDEEITSPFSSSTCSSLEGAKHKHMQKSRRFNRVAYLKPVALEKRISCSELQGDEPIYNLDKQPCSVLVPNMCTQNGYSNMLRDNVEEKARDLLNHVKRSTPSNCLRIEAEKMLFDFFKQSIGENNDIDSSLMKRQLCKVAGDWIRGQPQEQYLGWEVWEGRRLYIKEMDKCGNWRNSDEEIECLAMELEVEFFTSLFNDLLLDFTTC